VISDVFGNMACRSAQPEGVTSYLL